MKFSQDALETGYAITAYEPGCLKIRETEYRTSILLTPEQIIGPWEISQIEELTAADLALLTQYQPDIRWVG